MQHRILIADDHDVVRRGLRSLLESQPAWMVCGEATNGREAVELAHKLKPEVVILDMTMPELGGLDAARQILKALPRTEVLVLTMHESEELVHEVLHAGARGYVLKTDSGRDLLKAVEALSEHRTFFSPKIGDMVVQGYVSTGSQTATTERRIGLTPREREVLHLLAEGKTNKEVATALGISSKTAEAHRVNVMRKLNVHSIAEIVRYAVRNQLLSP